MKKEVLFFIASLIITGLFWYINLLYGQNYLEKSFYTLLSFSLLYFIFNILFQGLAEKRIKSSKTKYSFRKATSALFMVVFLASVITIWIGNPQTLLVSYGLIAAGVAIALQDYFKNFVGGISIFMTGVYRIGDRIEINSKYGDIIDIGIFYTTVMEMKEWVDGDQATGRISSIPNGWVLSNTVNNYTKDHNFIWDEIKIPITYDSDWKSAHEKILNIALKETEEISSKADSEISKLEEKYYLDKKPTRPSIFITLTDNWISFNLRYVTEVRGRRFLSNKLSQMILEEIEKSKNIKVASSTLQIVGNKKAFEK